MKLVDDPQRALRSYSFWLMLACSLTFLVPYIAYSVFQYDGMDPIVMGWLGIGFNLGALILRLVAQPDGWGRNLLRIIIALVVISIFGLLAVPSANAGGLPEAKFQPRDAPITSGATVTEKQIIENALPFLEKWEGVRLKAYIPVPGDVPTICSGTTRGVKLGMVLTPTQCKAMLRSEATEYWRGVAAYMTEETLRSRISVPRGGAWTSFSINLGWVTAGRATAMRRLNAGDIRGSCDAMTWYNRAGGRIMRGLVNRRGAEWVNCMAGLGNA
ncbi:lysozyme [Thioclava dalianensis]|nr:lysozyme [Thioclava dalianensis]